MIKVNFIIVGIVLGAAILVYGIIKMFYFLNKFSDPDSEEERVWGFLYFLLPNWYHGSNEDFFYLLRAGFIIIFVLAGLYALLFKMPIPFIWKPLLVIAS
jgi:hypothetical protein